MVHPLTASPWTPEETSHIMTESQPCLSALVQLIWFRSSMHWVKTACLLFLAELRIGSTDDPFSLFLEGWYLERKKLPSMTRDTFSGLLSDGSFSLLPPKKEHWRVPYESLSLAPVSPSPYDHLHFEGGNQEMYSKHHRTVTQREKNMEMVKSLGFRMPRLVRNWLTYHEALQFIKV